MLRLILTTGDSLLVCVLADKANKANVTNGVTDARLVNESELTKLEVGTRPSE